MISAAATSSEPGVGSRTPRWANAVSSVLGARRAGAMELGEAIHDTVLGAGADVVVVPGLGVSRYLERTQRLIARRARVHRLELPGTADGDQPGSVLTLAGDVAAVISWLREHTPRGAVLVGHSYGTQVAARVAAAVPRLVRALVLASPTVDPAYRHVPVLLVRWRMDDARAARGLAETNRPQQRGTGPKRILAMTISMLADDIETSLHRVSAPATILRGERDALSTRTWVRRLAAVTRADYVSVPGNHTFPFDRPEELAAAVADHLCPSRPRRTPGGKTMTIEPRHAVAEFDSATAVLSATAAALRGEPFPHLGQSARQAFPVRMSWLLPRSPRRAAYSILGGAEGIPADRAGDLDMATVAEWLVGHYDTTRRYPGVVIGATNGAAVHLCGATGMPFLPQTVLVPVHRPRHDPDRPDEAMEFGRSVAPPLLDRNPDVVLHHMHDGNQDRLMVRHMSYFRLKWWALPEAYRRFLADCLEPGAPVILLADESTWPTTRIGDRHVFQAGAQGGLTADEYIRGSTRVTQFLRENGSHHDRFQAPEPDGISSEAEWGFESRLGTQVAEWARQHGHSLTYVRLPEPEALSHPVAQSMRRRVRDAGAAGDRLLVESFAMVDHTAAQRTGSVPYWSFFPVDSSLQQAKTYLETVAAAGDPYHDVDVMLFPHGVSSVGATSPSEWAEQVLPHITGRVRFVSGTAQRWPAHFDALAKYGRALRMLPTRTRDVDLLPVDRALAELSSDRVRVETDGQLHV